MGESRPTDMRFWDRVHKADDPSGCWLWTGSGRIYGKIRLQSVHGQKGAHVLVHRYAWELHHGAIPAGMLVCHRCDVPRCVNPSHLFLGTYQDNRDDCVRKRRHAYGERNAGARLTVAEVHAIRTRARRGESQRRLARAFATAKSSIARIVHGETWAYLGSA